MKKIKLLICYHKPDVLLKDDILTPIHVGRAIAKREKDPDDPDLKWLLDNMIGDDTGENISLLNRTYNELTALYWAWKNYDKIDDPDYIGLMHYRRHFVFNEGEIKVYEIPEMGSPKYLDMLGYDPERLSEELESCDFACHLGKVDGIYKHFLASHRAEDMALALKLLKQMYPQYCAAADEYMRQDVGCFCNMFIFPKKMFFEYCEYIFGILEEFCRRVDIGEKRLFISERLTGIFIYEKMRQGLKYKVYPINFAAEGVNIPIAYAINKDNLYAVEVSMVSALENAKKGTKFTFYLMHGVDVTDEDKRRFLSLCENYGICRVEFVHSRLRREYYPLEISERLPKVKKLIYFNEKAIAMHDLSEFYRTCNVDDYYISGLPEGGITNVSKNRRLSEDIFVINCERFRKHRILAEAKPLFESKSAIDILNLLCEDQIGCFAEWFVTLAGGEREYMLPIRSKLKNRGQYQLEATWRPVLYYGENEPWVNIQGLYSNFWWNYAVKAPMLFKFPADAEKTERVINAQQKELSRIEYITQGGCRDDLSRYLSAPESSPLKVRMSEEESEDKLCRARCDALKNAEKALLTKPHTRRKTPEKLPSVGTAEYGRLSVFNKMRVYFRTYGFIPTIKRAFEKLTAKA